VGVILAGGAGRRMGGAKAAVKLSGRPLISYPLEAVWRALGSATILAKIDSELPDLPGVTVWVEPQTPRHPLIGIVHALELAEGRPVLACAVDLPFVTSEIVRAIASADPGGSPAVVASSDGRLQPLLACYQPRALELLAPSASDPDARLTETVEALGPHRFEVDDPDLLFNVNSPDDLLIATAMLDSRGAASRR
jgi:molybdopterin-guanine dinucleotide biosynthesis protein A